MFVCALEVAIRFNSDCVCVCVCVHLCVWSALSPRSRLTGRFDPCACVCVERIRADHHQQHHCPLPPLWFLLLSRWYARARPRQTSQISPEWSAINPIPRATTLFQSLLGVKLERARNHHYLVPTPLLMALVHHQILAPLPSPKWPIKCTFVGHWRAFKCSHNGRPGGAPH